jgi:3-deoxy-7-phosphoheptulonate synthase
VDSARLEALPGVLQVIHVTQPYKQVSREWRPSPPSSSWPTAPASAATTSSHGRPVLRRVRGADPGDRAPAARAGATILRGGAFKPRTSPYAFQGLGVRGLELLARGPCETGMAIVTEALETGHVAAVAEYADIIQIGARNMQNYPLLRRAGRTGKPILLKRGLSATIKELLLSAEYILAEGNRTSSCASAASAASTTRPATSWT